MFAFEDGIGDGTKTQLPPKLVHRVRPVGRQAATERHQPAVDHRTQRLQPAEVGSQHRGVVPGEERDWREHRRHPSDAGLIRQNRTRERDFARDEQIRAAMKRVIKDKNLKKICAVYQDDDFGQEVLQGGEHALKDLGMTYAEKTSYKRGATDFSSQVAKMKEAGCDGVVMGTIIRETIGVIATGRKLDWNPAFVGTTASYFDIIHKLGGAAVDGFYSACTINYPYADDPKKEVRDLGFERQRQRLHVQVLGHEVAVTGPFRRPSSPAFRPCATASG